MMTRLLLLFLLAVTTSGCTGSLESAHARGQLVPRAAGEARPSKRCQELDAEYRRWSAWSAAFIAGSGTSGVGQMPVDQLPERYRNTTRFALAGGTVTFAFLAAYAQDRAAKASETWARDCSE